MKVSASSQAGRQERRVSETGREGAARGLRTIGGLTGTAERGERETKESGSSAVSYGLRIRAVSAGRGA